jgi:hypothetical protein
MRSHVKWIISGVWNNRDIPNRQETQDDYDGEVTHATFEGLKLKLESIKTGIEVCNVFYGEYKMSGNDVDIQPLTKETYSALTEDKTLFVFYNFKAPESHFKSQLDILESLHNRILHLENTRRR